jgi:hypothetical protein
VRPPAFAALTCPAYRFWFRKAKVIAYVGSDNVTRVVTKNIGSGQRVYGWFEFLDADGTRFPISAKTVTIGRNPDNDIQLSNTSVHRAHAVLHMAGDRQFVISDLRTKNGVVVNNQRVEQRALQDGDLIELGEVRLRYYSHAGAVA